MRMPPKSMPPMVRPRPPVVKSVMMSPPSGDPKIDLILKRLDKLEQVMREIRAELEGVAMENADRVIRSLHENG